MNYCKYCMDPLSNGEVTCPKCASDSAKTVPAHRLLPGTLLNGRYRIGKVLGEGGFGITYIGRDIKLDTKVAVKEYYPNGLVNRNNTFSPTVICSVSGDKEEFFINGRKKFVKEARILAKFSNEPGIVEVRDFFEGNNTAYIIMEYLDGQDLKQYLKTNGTLSVSKAIQTLIPVMKSLTEIHKHGLLHRDISPDNIRLTPNGVKLLDFGAAREMTTQFNQSISVMLKPGYAPEEQYRSKGVQGPWTDVYAVCATLYKCITGITPDDAAQRSYSDELQKPSLLGVKISPATESVIMKGMSVRQQDRYQTMEELLNALLASLNAINTNSGVISVNPPVINADKTIHIGIESVPKPKPPQSNKPSGNSVSGSKPRTSPLNPPSAPKAPISNPPPAVPINPPLHKPVPKKDPTDTKIVVGVITAVAVLLLVIIGIGFLVGLVSDANSSAPVADSTYNSQSAIQSSPPEALKDYSQDLIQSIFDGNIKNFASIDITGWPVIEAATDQWIANEIGVNSAAEAYEAVSISQNRTVTNASEFFQLLRDTSSLDQAYKDRYGDNIQITLKNYEAAYLTTDEALTYIQATQTRLDSYNQYGINSSLIDTGNIENYAKSEFSVTYTGSEAYNTCTYLVVYGYINGDWKAIYYEENNDPLYLWSVEYFFIQITD